MPPRARGRKEYHLSGETIGDDVSPRAWAKGLNALVSSEGVSGHPRTRGEGGEKWAAPGTMAVTVPPCAGGRRGSCRESFFESAFRKLKRIIEVCHDIPA